MNDEDSLKDYREKRDFHRSPEPAGEAGRPGEKPIFVIQKHDARTLHYDFRLEVGRVLKSWAIPKGPSTDPRQKRLAVPTEDHPLEYARFEGVIPGGEYGAGTVLIWDMGTYRNLKEGQGSMEECLKEGHVAVWLEGKKLQGGYALIRTGKNGRWLLVKMDDEQADSRRDPLDEQPQSALSGRTIEEIAAQGR
jgi:DNA ligase D-like protein (predicted 3'-phosphoesterase)